MNHLAPPLPGERGPARSPLTRHPLVRLVVYYLRSRLLGTAVAIVIASASIGWYLLDQSTDPGITKILLLLAPVGAATAIGISARSPFGETERITSFHLPALRLGHMLALLAVSAAALTWANGTEPDAWTEWVMVRNLAGYAGLSLLTARLFGPSISWLPPVAYAMSTFIAIGGIHFDDMTDTQRRWGWPVLPGDDRVAAWTVATLLAAGLLLVCTGGGRDRVEENGG
ncbi:MAG: hypothetical protein AVDCRST_MAG70-1815 [uncultured Thermomicrobiales bacterium]|uniref:Uncharacterized protein n=1 Tax=uncultured Thermomicrobiales bacterium TaxID=1645740 RepID=A0A6J4UWZ7_9BACT|nr:MAG: hypothetical protein AVDCRST_MAG70-1815 [uncultured Thermomicrobiales bacterium]